MPIVSATIEIAAPPGALFALSQDYGLRRAWDPFIREMRFLDGAKKAGEGVRVAGRAWNGMTMEVRFTSFRPPRSVAMRMTRGPWFFAQFAGTWVFEPTGAGSRVTFRYFFRTKPALFRSILEPIIAWAFRRDIEARLRGLKRGAEVDGLLEKLGQPC
jgi:ribosome-associated toxin RatA of RatAB toxin-antitoxin module